MRFAYQYRLYSKQAQVQFLENQLHEACELYNAALEERRGAVRGQLGNGAVH